MAFRDEGTRSEAGRECQGDGPVRLDLIVEEEPVAAGPARCRCQPPDQRDLRWDVAGEFDGVVRERIGQDDDGRVVDEAIGEPALRRRSEDLDRTGVPGPQDDRWRLLDLLTMGEDGHGGPTNQVSGAKRLPHRPAEFVALVDVVSGQEQDSDVGSGPKPVEDLADDLAESDAGVVMLGQGDRVAHRVRRRPGPDRKEDRRGLGAGW